MSQNTLIEKIKQDAATAVAEIKSTETSKVADLQREADEVIKNLTETKAVAEKKQHAQVELVAVSRAKQAGKIAIQSAKREQIDALFSELEAEFIAQPEAEYIAFFAKHSATIIPAKVVVTEVYAPANRVAETKKVLAEFSFTGEVTVDDSVKAGFVAHTEDGVYDVTLNRLFNEKRSDLEMEVVSKVMSA